MCAHTQTQTHRKTDRDSKKERENCCQAGSYYQRCASTCPTTFPRNHGNPEIARVGGVL